MEQGEGSPGRSLGRRQSDHWLGRIFLIGAGLWEWIDKRQIDQHAVSVVILYGTWTITKWAMAFGAAANGIPGLEKAAIIGAVVTPYSALQAAAIKWYFERGK